jgi:hypothetical protein
MGEGARLAAPATCLGFLIVGTQQHGREKRDGTEERVLYAHISKYSFSPQEEEEKGETRGRRAGGAQELEQGGGERGRRSEEECTHRINHRLAPPPQSPMPQVFIALLIFRNRRPHGMPVRSTDGMVWARRGGVPCREGCGHHASSGPSPPHRTQVTPPCPRWLVVPVRALLPPRAPHFRRVHKSYLRRGQGARR